MSMYAKAKATQGMTVTITCHICSKEQAVGLHSKCKRSNMCLECANINYEKSPHNDKSTKLSHEELSLTMQRGYAKKVLRKALKGEGLTIEVYKTCKEFYLRDWEIADECSMSGNSLHKWKSEHNLVNRGLTV